MVQIIEENRPKSFLERLGGGLQEGVSAGSKLIPEYLEGKKKKKLLVEQESAENEALKRMGIDLSGIKDPKMRQAYVENALQGKLLDKKNANKGADDKELQKVGQKAFNRMSQILKGGNLGRGSGIKSMLGGQTARDTGEFTSLSGALESMLVDKVSRGTLSNSRFEYIKNTLLPTSSDSDAQIEGKLKGLAEILGLDPSELTGKSNKLEASEKRKSLEEIFG